MGLIDKIKAEVEKKTHGEQGYSSGDAECGYRDCARDILSFLNTLQVKEVDLEKEIEEHLVGMPMSEFTHDGEVEDYWDWGREEFRYFFELGLKAQKGE